jgi:hypothetical protein
VNAPSASIADSASGETADKLTPIRAAADLVAYPLPHAPGPSREPVGGAIGVVPPTDRRAIMSKSRPQNEQWERSFRRFDPLL